MVNDAENIQSDSAHLHEEILELAKEHSDIIEHADDYRERWQTVFPDGMLEELCIEFQCCPSLVFIALETITGHNTPSSQVVSSKPIYATNIVTKQQYRFESQAKAITELEIKIKSAAQVICRAITSGKKSFRTSMEFRSPNSQ